jgi:hypothetical protein
MILRLHSNHSAKGSPGILLVKKKEVGHKWPGRRRLLKFRSLSNERESLYSHLTEERFLGVFGAHFAPVQRVVLENRRVLHLLEPK